MPGPHFPYTRLDYQQVITQCFDESKDRLRVDATLTFDGGGGSEIVISDIDDSIKIGSGAGVYLVVNPDGSINVNSSLSAINGDSISISRHQNQFIYKDNVDMNNVDLDINNYTQIFTYTVTDSNMNCLAIKVKADTFGIFKFKVNNVTEDFFQTSQLERNCIFTFYEHYKFSLGDVIKIDFRPDRLLLNSYNFFLRIEGYKE